MKLSRSYLLGLGSGLILSALIAMVLPDGNIKRAEEPAALKNQETSLENSMNEEPLMEQATTEKPKTKDPSTEIAGSEELAPSTQEGQRIFTIPAGASAEKIADLLVKDHWIANKADFLSFVNQKRLASKFQAGNFELISGMSLEEVVNQLIK